MVKTIIVTKLSKIIRNKKRLEEKLNVKITNRGREIKIIGNPQDEFIAEKVIEALDFGFVFSQAIEIKEEDFVFEKFSIKDYTHRKNLESVRARVIGTKGKTLNTVGELTGCFVELNENEVGIIGPALSIKNAQDAVISIIQGAKQSNAYKMLEKNKPVPIVDLGLREK